MKESSLKILSDLQNFNRNHNDCLYLPKKYQLIMDLGQNDFDCIIRYLNNLQVDQPLNITYLKGKYQFELCKVLSNHLNEPQDKVALLLSEITKEESENLMYQLVEIRRAKSLECALEKFLNSFGNGLKNITYDIMYQSFIIKRKSEYLKMCKIILKAYYKNSTLRKLCTEYFVFMTKNNLWN